MAINAPEGGIIKELLVNEEDTVIVGQDLIRLEPGSSGSDVSSATPPKQPESDRQDLQTQHQAVAGKEAKQPAQWPLQATPASSQTPGSRLERRVRTIRYLLALVTFL